MSLISLNILCSNLYVFYFSVCVCAVGKKGVLLIHYYISVALTSIMDTLFYYTFQRSCISWTAQCLWRLTTIFWIWFWTVLLWVVFSFFVCVCVSTYLRICMCVFAGMCVYLCMHHFVCVYEREKRGGGDLHHLQIIGLLPLVAHIGSRLQSFQLFVN